MVMPVWFRYPPATRKRVCSLPPAMESWLLRSSPVRMISLCQSVEIPAARAARMLSSSTTASPVAQAVPAGQL